MADLISRSTLIKALKGCTVSNGTLINTNTMLAVIEKFPSTPEHNYENCHNATCRRKCQEDGYNKAIDDFVKRIKIASENCVDEKGWFNVHISYFDDLAQQLKEGVNNESDC